MSGLPLARRGKREPLPCHHCFVIIPTMPQGLVRFQQSGQSHFVTFSCYRRQPRLADKNLCHYFLASLERVRSERALRVYGYLLMPEHVHLLLSEPERGLLCDAILAIKISVARHHGGGRLWQRRYYDRNVSDHAEFVEKLRYIHRNPVARGLVERPEDWEWSSFRHYAEDRDTGVEIESEWTAMRREGRIPKPMKLPEVETPTSGQIQARHGAPSKG